MYNIVPMVGVCARVNELCTNVAKNRQNAVAHSVPYTCILCAHNTIYYIYIILLLPLWVPPR